MPHFKKFALLAVLALSGAAFADAAPVTGTTAVGLTNTAPDTLTADASASMDVGGKTGTSTLSWTTAAASPDYRKITVSVEAADSRPT